MTHQAESLTDLKTAHHIFSTDVSVTHLSQTLSYIVPEERSEENAKYTGHLRRQLFIIHSVMPSLLWGVRKAQHVMYPSCMCPRNSNGTGSPLWFSSYWFIKWFSFVRPFYGLCNIQWPQQLKVLLILLPEQVRTPDKPAKQHCIMSNTACLFMQMNSNIHVEPHESLNRTEGRTIASQRM